MQTGPPGAAAVASGLSGQLSTGREQPHWCAGARLLVRVPPVPVPGGALGTVVSRNGPAGSLNK